MAITITETRVQDQSSGTFTNTGTFNIQDAINQASAELNSYINDAQEAATTATNEASKAKDSADAARKSEVNAKTSETNAKTYADSASASAKAAKESENSVATAISEANYQELYLENGVLMLYQSDASRSSLDFFIEDHKYLEVKYL